MKFLNYLFAISIIATTTIKAQETYYVAPVEMGGNDQNVGTFDAPLASIEHALTLMVAGDTCYLREGTYREQVQVNDLSASSNKRTVITSYNNEFVSIDGTTLIESNWIQHQGNIYKTTLENDIWQLFVDSAQMVMARWPNAQFSDDGVYDWTNWAQGIENGSSNGSGKIDPAYHDLASSGINIQNALGILNVGSFKTWTQKITSHTTGSNSFSYEPVPGTYKSKHHYFFFEGKLEFLDNPNEWLYDSSDKTLYLYTDNGTNPNGRIIQGKTQSYAFDINNCSNLEISGLYFVATTLIASVSDKLLIENCHFSFPNCSKRMLGNDEGLEVSSMGKPGGYVHNSIIRKCLFEHTDGEGLRIYGNNNTLENCYFHHIDYTASELEGLMVSILINGTGNKIKNNTIHSTGASATVLPGDESEFSYNKVTKTGFVQSDGAVYQGTKNTVFNSNTHHNIIYQTPKYALRYDAPVGDAGSAGTQGKMHHNIAWETNGIMVKGNEHHIAYNTCFSNTGNGIIILAEDNSNLDSYIQNNLAEKMAGHRSNSSNTSPVPGIVNNNWNGYDHPNTNISSLINLNNYMPKENSEIIDAGIEIPEIPHNTIGNSPDIGAQEHGATPWTAGVDWTPNFYPYNNTSVGLKKEKPAIGDQFYIYPNPSKNYINIEAIDINTSNYSIAIYDAFGRVVYKAQNSNIIYTINIDEFNNGVYWVEIISDSNRQISPIIKQ